MGDFPTLITGPSGTGKELIARAIAGARYVPFDPERMEFADAPGESFLPINIAALSPTLIESELFGHRRGSFTGAIGDRKGWLEACPPSGSVFLDELGEMDLAIQVKLLRVIETRRFSAVGDTAAREFHGKLIAATNRELAGRDSGRPVPRRSLLSPVRGSDPNAVAGRSDSGYAAGAARAGALHDRCERWVTKRSAACRKWSSGSRSICPPIMRGRGIIGNWSSACGT